MIVTLLERRFRPLISYVLISPGSRYTRKEFKEKTGLHNKTLDEALAQLCALQVLKKEKRIYSIDNTNEQINKLLTLLKEEEQRLDVPFTVLQLLEDVIDWCSRNEKIKHIYLFGSYAKKIQHEKSDVDITLITKQELTKQEKSALYTQKEKIKEKYGKEIEVHIFTEAEFKRQDSLIKEIKQNGKKIY